MIFLILPVVFCFSKTMESGRGGVCVFKNLIVLIVM